LCKSASNENRKSEGRQALHAKILLEVQQRLALRDNAEKHPRLAAPASIISRLSSCQEKILKRHCCW
jgi:hypothetical protein